MGDGEKRPSKIRVVISVEAASYREGVHLAARLASQYQGLPESDLEAIARAPTNRGDLILNREIGDTPATSESVYEQRGILEV
jgi:hypothetical protein